MSLTRMSNYTQKFSDISGDYISKDSTNIKALLDSQPKEVRDFIINTLIPEIETQYASKVDLNSVVAGQINTTDPITGKKYAFGIENGLVKIVEVG